MERNLHVRVVREQRLLRGLDLGAGDIGGLVEDLALQVGAVDHIEVDQPDRADAGEGKVEGDGRAEPACADDEHLRLDDLALPNAGDLGHDEMAAVALDHLGGERDTGPAGEGGDEGNLVARGEARGFALDPFDLDLVHVDANMGRELAAGVAHLGGKAGELHIEVVHDLAQVRPDRAHTHAVADEVAEGGGDVDVDAHGLCLAAARAGGALGWWGGTRRRARGRH